MSEIKEKDLVKLFMHENKEAAFKQRLLDLYSSNLTKEKAELIQQAEVASPSVSKIKQKLAKVNLGKEVKDASITRTPDARID